jgi:serine/arginine repetitive matrix protein 2
VEAGSDTENTYAQYDEDGELASPSRTTQPLNRRMERTTTTTVPLKGLSDSEGENLATTPKRGRGRPRKSGTPIPAKQNRHSITPTRKNRRRRKSIGEQVYGDSEIDEDFQIGKSDETKRGRRRPRKSRLSESLGTPIPSVVNSMAKERRKSLLPGEIVVLEDEGIAYTADLEGSPELHRALSPIDSNAAQSPSAYPTTSSPINDAGDEPDATLAVFHPSGDTPRTVGWPRPRIVDSSQTASPAQRNSYPSPSSLEKPQSHTREEAGDEPEEGPEFDTVLEGEGFSMISVDSVPSLRQHLSSPPKQTQQSELSKNVSAQQTPMAHGVTIEKYESSTVSGRNVGKLATMQKPKNRVLLAVQDTEMDDSFSSIPSEVLEAATPGRNLPTPTAPEATAQQSEAYDDSFSAIPSAILDAATPAALRQTLFKPGNAHQTNLAPDSLIATASNRSASSALRRGRGPITARLLTPEETPSPGDISGSNNATSSSTSRNITSNGVATEQEPGNESYVSSQMKSSPPAVVPQLQTRTAHIQPEPQSYPRATQTPSIVFSSPTLPPPIQPAKENPFLGSKLEQSPKPALSPAARVGRMLQDLVVPSSPRNRAQSLGSPFKSPVAERKSSNVANAISSSSEERRVQPPSRADVGGNLFREAQSSGFDSSVHDDDPFLNSLPSPGKKELYLSDALMQPPLSDAQLSNARSEGNSLQSDDVMSWQAEEVVSMSQDTSADNQINSSAGLDAPLHSESAVHCGSGDTAEMPTCEEKLAAERAAVSREIEATYASKVIVLDSEDGAHALEIGNEGEDFGLLLETLNSSSPAPQTHYQRSNPDRSDQPRRTLSPRNKNNKRSLYSDELSHLSSPIPARVSLIGNVSSDANRDVAAAELSSSRPRSFSLKPRIRDRSSQDVFALLAASPDRPPPVLTSKSSDSSSLPTRSSPNHSLNVDTLSATKSLESQQYFRPIPQKSDFKPRMRDPESSFGSSPIRQPSYGIFGAQIGKERLSISSAPRPLRAPSSSATDALPSEEGQASSVQLSSPVAISESTPDRDEEEGSVLTNRTKAWTESVRLASAQMQGFTSPTKSCLRSPLKTPTGGSGSRNSGSSSKTVAFVSSSPIPSPAGEETLSSTTWSREHWILLDAVLQNWKPENQVEEGNRRRNSTRVISKLLGKNVRSGNEKMKLEQWHLEVVDEFRGCVPGWKEETIAMRVFALIVGERDRALGLVGRNGGESKSRV